MSAPLALRLVAGAEAVLLAGEVADVLGLTRAEAELLLARVSPLRATGPRGSRRYRYGDLLAADRDAPVAPPARLTIELADDVRPRRPGLR